MYMQTELDERVQFSENCCHSERSAKRGVEESAFDYVAKKRIPHFVRNDIPARLNYHEEAACLDLC